MTVNDLDDTRAIALAYCRERKAGHGDLPAYQAALATYSELHPETPALDAQHAVTRAIAQVADQNGAWLYGRVED